MTSLTQADTPGWRAEGRGGAIAGGGAAAVAAGRALLAEGGNAFDAAAAATLALCVTDHGQCSIGGEAPALVYDARAGEVRAVCGQGRAPRDPAAIAWYLAHGIPDRDIKMAPVPSVVDSVVTLLRRWGTRSFEEAARPALALLDAGAEPWHPRLARTLRRMVDEERRTPGGRAEKLASACDRFYGRHPSRNDIAEELEAFYIEQGGFLRRADLAAHGTTVEDPVTVRYHGHTVCKCGPWTQGPMLCQALRLLEGFDLRARGRGSADVAHLGIEALKLALADRDAYYGDPDFVGVPLSALLSDPYTELRRALIDPRAASRAVRPGDPYGGRADRAADVAPGPAIGGTTTCVVGDRWGNVVAITPSANVCADGHHGGPAGVTYGNRLRSLNTTPGHPNCIQPGKRPRITLTPTLVLREGRPVLAVSVAGGDLQDQATLNLLLDAIDFGLEPAAAVTGPRFATAHHEDSFNPDPDRARTFKAAGSLTIGPGADPGVVADLAARGHRVAVAEGPVAAPVLLRRDPATGWLQAAGDPAAGRHAAGLD